ncbi:MAG: hypothetical protein WA885_10590 [Phormidesmis sp.]
MALPPRLKSALRPAAKVGKVISPTGVGVLLSVGAHAALLIFGPQTDLSLAASDPSAQGFDTEETIVPLVQLSAAERNRLPNFAQPRLPVPNPADLNQLSLPSGLPSLPNTTNSLTRRRIAANPFPAATLPQPQNSAIAPIRSIIPSYTLPKPPSVGNLGISTAPRAPGGVTFDPSLNLPASPSPADTGNEPNNASPSPDDQLPVLEPTVNTAQILEGLEQRSTSEGSSRDIGDFAANLPANRQTDAEENEASVDVNVEPPSQIATATAQGAPGLLQNGNEYDDFAVTEEEAAKNTEAWLLATAKGKEDVIEQDTAEFTIDSGFKACREVPPADGLIGVVVNPDGSQEAATVLKSIGYDVLNRLALSQLEYQEFSPEAPTQYQVTVKVNYKPENCVEDLPDAPTE